VGFDSSPKLVQDFTSDGDVAGNAIRGLSRGNGGTASLDGLGFALYMLRQQPTEYRRAILLISETVDHGSRVTLDDALREISDTNTAIYSLGFSSSKSDVKHEASKVASREPGPAGGWMSQDPKCRSRRKQQPPGADLELSEPARASFAGCNDSGANGQGWIAPQYSRERRATYRRRILSPSAILAIWNAAFSPSRPMYRIDMC
jgi:hypothetical protein